tara:strand:- start:35642 stop:36034 length:393 start_codon:yes stop_codon:yes gene_type:complete
VGSGLGSALGSGVGSGLGSALGSALGSGAGSGLGSAIGSLVFSVLLTGSVFASSVTVGGVTPQAGAHKLSARSERAKSASGNFLCTLRVFCMSLTPFFWEKYNVIVTATLYSDLFFAPEEKCSAPHDKGI